MNGFHGDSAYTFEVGELNQKSNSYLRLLKNRLDLALDVAVVW